MPIADEKELANLLNFIKTWMVTESGPTRMKFSHPALQLSVTIIGYKKIILERNFQGEHQPMSQDKAGRKIEVDADGNERGFHT